MNRDLIEQGKTWAKWAESLALVGGVGAIIYPLFFYYVGWTAIDGRDDFLVCSITEAARLDAKNEEFSDYVRACIQWNCIMMVVYLVLHFNLFARPEDIRSFRRLGVAYSVVLAIEIVGAVATMIATGISICNDGSFASAAILTSVAIIVVNLFTLIGTSVFFQWKTHVSTARVAVQSQSQDRPA